MSQVRAGDVGVGSWIERRARIAPEHPALISGARSVSYAELAERIRRLANGLRRLGVARGDRVSWLGPNHQAFLESLFAVGQLGAALAPINHRLDAAQQASILSQTEPVAQIEHGIAEPTTWRSIRHRLVIGDGPTGTLDYEALVAESADRPVGEAVGLDDLLFLPHTSGTTGTPKAVMLSHGNVTWNAVNLITSADFRSDDVTIAIAPFFRVGGTGVNVLPVLFMGGTVVVPDAPDPDRILGLMEEHRVTVGFGNPDSLDALTHAASWATVDVTSLRFVLTGGAPVPDRLLRTYLDRGITLLQGYGLSEAAPFVLLLDSERALRKIGSAGRPALFVDVRIADPAGVDVPPGQTGELLVRGPNVMAGYWKRPAETRDVLLDGVWLRTGDAARMDGDGDVWIVDRVRAKYVSAGVDVYPGDVERALLEHPSVVDAGVIGVSGPDGRTVGAAFVVLLAGVRATEDELLAFGRERLAPHQVPASISIVDKLPRSAVGKLLREELARLAPRQPLGGG